MKVIIVGAGVGGLTLAAALLAKLPAGEVSVRVFERDASPDDRAQGYGLSLRGDMGLKVLDAIGLSEARKPICTPTRDFYFTTPAGWQLMRLGTSDPASPYYQCRVQRPELRQLLLSRIPPDTITWGSKAVGYRLEGDRAVVRFDNGTEEAGDVVVACDGTHCKLRSQMLGLDNSMMDVTLINGRAEAKPLLCKYLHETGTLFTIGNGQSVFATLNESGEAAWSFAFHCPAGSLAGASQQDLHRRVLTAVSTWKQEPIARMVSATDPATIKMRELVDRKMPSSAREGRVVLLGDACHPMTPYLGLGANTAMLDALSLANGIAAHRDSIPAALEEFETEMLRRAAVPVAASRKACLSYHRCGWFSTVLRNTVLWSFGTVLSLLPQRRDPASKK